MDSDKVAKAAFIIGRAVMMLCRIEMAKAANLERLDQGYSIAYGEEQFADIEKEFCDLEYNNMSLFFRD